MLFHGAPLCSLTFLRQLGVYKLVTSLKTWAMGLRERERERGEDAIDLYAKLAAVVVAL